MQLWAGVSTFGSELYQDLAQVTWGCLSWGCLCALSGPGDGPGDGDFTMSNKIFLAKGAMADLAKG